MNAISIFKCLGDETRYKIVCMLYHSDSYVELLAEKLNLTPGTISFHLKKMEAQGIVKCSRSQFYMIYSLNHPLFEKSLGEFVKVELKMDDDQAYRDKVIASFFKKGKLTNIPVQQKKREIVLSELMKAFVMDSYDEKSVNEILKKYYEDYCTLRRELVSKGYFTRQDGIYRVVGHPE